MRYPAYLEIGPNGFTVAYVFALPGLSVRARRPEDALAALPDAIRAENARLTAAGRTPPAPAGDDAVEVDEAERIAVEVDVERGALSAMFRYELRPTKDDDVALALDRVALAREELLRSGAPPEAFAALADSEWWLLSRLGTRPFATLPADPRERFDAVRALTLERLAHLLPGDRERHAVFGGEPWTTRKVLRRLACLARDAAAAAAGAANAR